VDILLDGGYFHILIWLLLFFLFPCRIKISLASCLSTMMMMMMRGKFHGLDDDSLTV